MRSIRTNMRSTFQRNLYGRLLGRLVFGDSECGPKFHDRSFFLIEECCPAVESVLSSCCHAGSCSNDTTFNRIHKFRFDRSGRKMGTGRHQTLDRHYDGGIRQADQCPAMHQSASLSEIDKKRHGQNGSTVTRRHNFHVQQSPEMGRIDPGPGRDRMRTGQ